MRIRKILEIIGLIAIVTAVAFIPGCGDDASSSSADSDAVVESDSVDTSGDTTDTANDASEETATATDAVDTPADEDSSAGDESEDVSETEDSEGDTPENSDTDEN